ncbi:MAG: hotdog domain-containing protein, partial [Vicinamibacterales bacterium]
LNVRFLRPARPGRLVGQGRIVHRNGDIASLEAVLRSADNVTIATATATARVIPLAQAPRAV